MVLRTELNCGLGFKVNDFLTNVKLKGLQKENKIPRFYPYIYNSVCLSIVTLMLTEYLECVSGEPHSCVRAVWNVVQVSLILHTGKPSGGAQADAGTRAALWNVTRAV